MAAAAAADFSGRVSDSLNNFFSGTGTATKATPLRDLLESGKEKDALEAMKRIISMMSKGQDVSNLFPHVVKHVVSPSMEVKKLVYVYLVRYAEEQPDIALLSINSFQKDLRGPNQFIRASALRVMSSIRVEVIVPLIMLAVKDTISDMSPYVKKVTAHAIPKIYSVDPSQRDSLIELIEKLLDDRTVLVLASALMAFEDVCPDRLDLLHKHYRKLCALVVDMEEWGQITCLNLLTRYARTQFCDPNAGDGEAEEDKDRPFYSDSETEESEDEKPAAPKRQPMDPDHRLLLNAVKPLLQSRNSGVVFAVAKLFYYLAPKTEAQIVGKTLVRLVYTQREMAYVVLSNIETMSAKRPSMFTPYIKSFFIKNDLTASALMKINILVNLATESNISTVQRELLAVVRSGRQDAVTAAIEGIGRCAAAVPDVAASSISALMTLLSSSNEGVVGMSIVVIKRLLQVQPEGNKPMVTKLAKMLLRNKITVPMARASVLWLIGENTEHVPRLAPDVLRVSVQGFAQATDVEKLQVLNLGAKLMLTGARRASKMMDHILNLARYDTNYDVRDRARLMRALLFAENVPILKEKAKELLMSSKPAPKWVDPNAGRGHFQLGTLSHVLNTELNGYQPLPDFPEVPPDPKPRQVDYVPWSTANSLSNRSGGFDMFSKPQAPQPKASSKGFYDSSSSDTESFYSDSDDSRSRSPSRSRSTSRSRSSSRSRSRSPSDYSRSPSRSRSKSLSRSPSRSRPRSVSPASDRSYSRSPSPGRRSRSPTPSDSEDERDKARTMGKAPARR